MASGSTDVGDVECTADSNQQLQSRSINRSHETTSHTMERSDDKGIHIRLFPSLYKSRNNSLLEIERNRLSIRNNQRFSDFFSSSLFLRTFFEQKSAYLSC